MSTFEEYAAQAARDPFPWPMPGGKTIAIPQPSWDTQRTAVAVAASGSLMDAVAVYAGAVAGVDSDDSAAIREAWGALPPSALSAAFDDLRKHFGSKNS